MKKIILLTIICLFFSLMIIVYYFEVNTSHLSDLHNFMFQNERNNGLISYAYITTAITIISLSAISFTLIIGMMQFFINEISYESYDIRVLKNKRIKQTFMALMGISILEIIIYIYKDISKHPITYSALLVMLLLLVVSILLSLFTSLLRDFSIYSVMENNHMNIIKLLDEYKKTKKEIAVLENKKHANNLTFLKKLNANLTNIRIKKLTKRNEELQNTYVQSTKSMTQELILMFRNACRRNDYQLTNKTLEYVSKLIMHRFDEFGITAEFIPFSYDLLGKTEDYDKFVELSLTPIYSSFDYNSSSREIVRISNEQFATVLIHGQVLKYTNDEDGYNLLFQIIFTQYISNIKRQLYSGYLDAISDYRNAMILIIQSFKISNSIELFIQISKCNLTFTEEVFKKFDPVNYIYLLEVEMNIFEKSLFSTNDYFMEVIIDDIFSMFKVCLSNYYKIREPYRLRDMNSYLLKPLISKSLPNLIATINREIYFKKLNDKIFNKQIYSILETLIESFAENITSIEAASRIDNMITFYFSQIVHQISEIIIVYLSNDLIEFEKIYKQSLGLFEDFISKSEIKKLFGYRQINEDFEKLLSESILNEKIRNITIESYIKYTKQVHRAIEDELYSSRCFNTLIKLPIIFNNEELYVEILEVIDNELSIEEIDILIEELDREFKNIDKMPSSKQRESFGSISKFEPDKVNLLLEKLRELIEKKNKSKKLHKD